MSALVINSGTHSHLGASSSKRWMNCPGSIELTRKLGAFANRSGKEAARGSAAHTIAAMCLTQHKEPWEFGGTRIDVEGFTFTVDKEMLDSITHYVDFVNDVADHYSSAGCGLGIEKPMKSSLHEDAYGTMDCVIYVPGDRIVIIDFKNGINVPVEPEDPQLRYYGYLAYENRPDYMQGDGKDPKYIEMWISQPRCMHPQGPDRGLTLLVDEVETWFLDEVLPAMERTTQENAPLKMGDWCTFCPAREHCPLLKREALAYPVDGDPEELTEEELGILLTKGEAIKKYFDRLQTVAFHRAMQGKKIPGRKLVRKISRRQWVDGAEEALMCAYGDAIMDPPKLRSPAQVEKALEDIPGSKDFVGKYVTKPDTGLTLAAESDKRIEASGVLAYDPILLDESIEI